MLRTASLVAFLTLAASVAAFADDPPAKGDSPVYELRVYHTNPGKLDALHARFRDHTRTLFEKHGMKNVGYWTPLDDKDGKGSTLYYVLAFPSREAAKKSWDAFRADPDWQKVKAESEKDGVLVDKVESTFLDATDYSPDALAPGYSNPGVFELRTYVASPGKFADLHKRFREHTLKLFAKHDMMNIAYWVPQDENQGHKDTLVYLLRHASRNDASASWRAFGADPDWQKVYKESQADGVPLAKTVKFVYLTPTDYSPKK